MTGIRRRLAAVALLCVGTIVGCAPQPDAAAPVQHRNVLLIVVDDLRPDLGSYGHPLVQSPNIDRLARRGIRFEHAYSQFPVCNPSRSSFLTGLRPSRTGIVDNEVHYRERLPETVTLPELFRRNGFFTASIGKVFHGAAGVDKGSQEAWDLEIVPRGRRRAREGDRKRFHYGPGRAIGWVAAGGVDEDQPDGKVAGETLAAIERAGNRPFFVAAGFLRPHAPLIAPRKYYDLYELEALESSLAAASDALPPVSGGVAQANRIGRREQLEILRAYYACISFVDAQIGLIFDALDRRDLWKNTVVILTSDHGIHLGERNWWWKNTLSEVSARVPLLVHVPGWTRDDASGALVELVDLYPTLSELFGLDPGSSLDGRSLTPLLREPDRPWKEAAFTQALRGDTAGYSVRTDRWRYTEWDDGARTELYDHREDPKESVNLAESPEAGEVIEELRARVRAHWALP